MAEKLKFREALKKVAEEAAGPNSKGVVNEAAKLVLAALNDGSLKPAVLDGVASSIASFLPKFRKNTNVASLDWSDYLPFIQAALELIARKLGL